MSEKSEPWPRSWLPASPGARCPSCDTTTGRPIVMGMPSYDLFEAVERGVIDVVLGGCIVGEDDATHRCGRCGGEFAVPSDDGAEER